jgi:uncharacterized protein involved in propanediol utilization
MIKRRVAICLIQKQILNLGENARGSLGIVFVGRGAVFHFKSKYCCILKTLRLKTPKLLIVVFEKPNTISNC